MHDDPFADHVHYLTRRHRDRHTSAVVAQVTLRGWLTMRGQYQDAYDVRLFARVDAALASMPPSRGLHVQDARQVA